MNSSGGMDGGKEWTRLKVWSEVKLAKMRARTGKESMLICTRVRVVMLVADRRVAKVERPAVVTPGRWARVRCLSGGRDKRLLSLKDVRGKCERWSL